MSLFLLTIFGCYGAVHIYTFFKIRAAFPFSAVAGALLGVFMAIMTCAPIFIRMLERQGYDAPAKLMSYIGYCWMGLIFLFFSLSVLLDIYHFVAHGSLLIFHVDASQFIPSARVSFLLPFLLALVICIYGFFDALEIRPEIIAIRTSKIPKTVGRLRIAQISDVHLGLIVRESRMRRILTVIRDANPDILISTGDLVDGQIDSLPGLADIFKETHPRYGKFAITGNHEFYAGLPQSLEITKRAGFSVLRGEAVTVAGLVNLAGIDDPTGKYFNMYKGVPEEELLSRLPKDIFTILLKHQPRINEKSLGLYDLQLSGHTHKGQIFPFRFFVRAFFSHVTGWHDLPKGSHLYVSRGTGTWGPPIRFLSSPEVTIIDIVHDSTL